jgi:hypothetical protein
MKAIASWILAAAATLSAQPQPPEFLNHNRPVLHAHNCYPDEGHWADRIDRALSAGFPVAIEQDLAWDNGRVIVIHDAKKIMGTEPTLRDYFFERVRPIVEKALKDDDRSRWPLMVLHFDFKTTQPELLHAVWDLLGTYEPWITTARKTGNPHELSPFDAKPILVITEDSDALEEVFFHQVPVGANLRLFGAAHTAKIPGESDREREHFAATLPPEKLLTERPTNYRRWWNNSWAVVEEGGQAHAGDWTPAEEQRLRALVQHAHHLGYWIRFYVLDGFTQDEDRGWNKIYNVGSREAVLVRWKAAIEAGVNLIATDQYEDLGALLKQATNEHK